LLRDFLENDSDNQKELIQYIFKRYEDFKIELYTIFEDLDEKKTVGRKLAKLQQINSTTIYAVQFQQIILQLQWNDENLMIYFYKDPKDDIKDNFYKEDILDIFIKYI